MSEEAVAGAIGAAKARSKRDWLVLSLLAEYGLKTGEVASLKPEHVRDGRLLLEGREVRLKEAHAQPLASSEGAYIFEGRKGRSLTNRQVQNIVKLCSARAGSELTPNHLRKHFARRFLENGGSLNELKGVLGHAHLQTTRRLLVSKN